MDKINELKQIINEQIEYDNRIINKIEIEHENMKNEIKEHYELVTKVNFGIKEVAKNIVNKVDTSNNDIMEKIVMMEELLNSLENKITQIDTKIENIVQVCYELKQDINNVQIKLGDQPNLESDRFLNAAIRTHTPITFRPTKYNKK